MFDWVKNIVARFTREGDEPSGAVAETVPDFSPRTGQYDLAYLYAGGSDAMKIATVYRCIRLISESVASLPLQYMRQKDGVFVADTNSRLHYLLTVQPNETQSAFDFWAQVIVNLLTDGNAYIVPVYSVSMEVDRLVLCGKRTVQHDVYNDTYSIVDQVNGISGVYTESEILHIKGPSVDGKTGLSVLTYARLTTSIAGAGDTETLNRFNNGGNVRGIISNDKSVTGFGEYQDKELQTLAQSIDGKFGNGHRIVSLPGQVDFKQISLSSTDMQFLESRKFTVRELCRFFGVHPSFVFDDTSNNYKSAEMANAEFLRTTINPVLRKIENECLRKLVAPTLATKRAFTFDRKAMYAFDLESRVKYQKETIAAGIYTVNDWRRLENQPIVEGGDQIFVSANLKSINDPSFTVELEPQAKPNKKNDNDDGEE